MKFLLYALSFFLLFSCDSDSKQSGSFNTENESLAVINNKKISLTEFQDRYRHFLEDYKSLIFNDKKNDFDLKTIILDRIIEEELMLQEAARRGVKVSEEELESVTTTSIYPYPDAKFETKLTREGSSIEAWQQRMKVFLLQKKLVEKEVLGTIPVTKREVLNYYKKNKKKFYYPRKHKVRQIVTSSYNNAKAILRKLKQGASFVQMVRLHSISPDKAVDGSLGEISRGVLPTNIENAIFKMKYKNELSDIVQTQQGFHIFKLERIRWRKKMPYDDAKVKIKSFLIEQKIEEFYKGWLKRLKEKARITVNTDLLKNIEIF